jgi:Fic family protein
MFCIREFIFVCLSVLACEAEKSYNTFIRRKFASNKDSIHRMVTGSSIPEERLVYTRKYIYERPEWPDLMIDEGKAASLLRDIRVLHGKQLGRLETLGFDVRENTMLSTITAEVIGSSEVEGERIDALKARSSAARRLGVERAGLVENTREVDGIVDMTLDAVQNFEGSISEELLLGWHAALFPAGRSGLHRILTGEYRKDVMQVASGGMGREKIHFQAPPPERVRPEMDAFFKGLSSESAAKSKMDPVILAALAHFRFVTIHPFDDGNGRIARAITERMLARAENSAFRYYSMSAQIMADRKRYYDVLEETQRYAGDINEWILWFLECLLRAIKASEEELSGVMKKTAFWDSCKNIEINERQRCLLNVMLDGFDGKMQSAKWAKIANCSTDTALRDIEDLIRKNILVKENGGGRSTAYQLATVYLERSKGSSPSAN